MQLSDLKNKLQRKPKTADVIEVPAEWLPDDTASKHPDGELVKVTLEKTGRTNWGVRLKRTASAFAFVANGFLGLICFIHPTIDMVFRVAAALFIINAWMAVHVYKEKSR